MPRMLSAALVFCGPSVGALLRCGIAEVVGAVFFEAQLRTAAVRTTTANKYKIHFRGIARTSSGRAAP
jgi:hypothetical protein